MPTHAAFLRGMNLGGRRITNDELCSHFEGMGFEEVDAFLASGNVVFSVAPGAAADGEALARRIEEGLQAALDYDVPTFLRTDDEVRAVAGHRPFSEDVVEAAAGKLQVALLGKPPSKPDRDAVLAHATDADRLALRERELYWLPDGPMSKSELDLAAIEKRLGTMTIRTARTLERLAAKYF